jgi:hypothetical protein
MALPLAASAVLAAALLPAPGDVVWPGDAVTARSALEVRVPAGLRSVATGDVWAARRVRSPSLLRWLWSVAPGGPAPAGLSPADVQGLDPVETAVLLGAGVARGRANAEQLGYTALLAEDVLPGASLAVALWAVDAAGDLDLSRGRQVLAPGVLGADGAVGCPDVPIRATIAAMPAPPDLIIIGAGCAATAPPDVPEAAVVEVASLDDAVIALSDPAR